MHSIAAYVRSVLIQALKRFHYCLMHLQLVAMQAVSIQAVCQVLEHSYSLTSEPEILELLLQILTSQCNSTSIRKYQTLLEVFGARRSLNVIYYTCLRVFFQSQVVHAVHFFFSTCNKIDFHSTVCDIAETRFAIFRLTTVQQAVRTRKQETDSTIWSLYMHFVHCTQWEKIQLEQKFSRAPVGSRHHFGNLYFHGITNSVHCGKTVHCLFFSLLEQTFWLYFHQCSIFNPINAELSLQSQPVLPRQNTILGFHQVFI